MSRIKLLYHICYFVFLFSTLNSYSLENKNIVVCTTADYHPIVYKTETGKFSGLIPDLLEDFSNLNSLPIEYKVVKLDGLIPSLLTKKCDIGAMSLMMTEKRKKILDFSLPLFTGQTYFIFYKSSSQCNERVQNSDFDNAETVIGMLQGSPQDDYMREHPDIFKFSKILNYESEQDIISALRTKKIMATINGSQFWFSLQEKFPEKFCGIPFKDNSGNTHSVPVGIAFRKDKKELTDKFNVYLKNLKETGKYTSLLEKYKVTR